MIILPVIERNKKKFTPSPSPSSPIKSMRPSEPYLTKDYNKIVEKFKS
jgi:hypothetical protein